MDRDARQLQNKANRAFRPMRWHKYERSFAHMSEQQDEAEQGVAYTDEQQDEGENDETTSTITTTPVGLDKVNLTETENDNSNSQGSRHLFINNSAL